MKVPDRYYEDALLNNRHSQLNLRQSLSRRDVSLFIFLEFIDCMMKVREASVVKCLVTLGIQVMSGQELYLDFVLDLLLFPRIGHHFLNCFLKLQASL